jgi:hypothetical protein
MFACQLKDLFTCNKLPGLKIFALSSISASGTEYRPAAEKKY